MKNPNIQLPSLQAQTFVLDNQTPLYFFPNKDLNVIRLEFLFANAGKINQKKPFIATIANYMMTEGTKNFTAFGIAEALDYYGAFVEKFVNHEAASVVFYFMKKHTESLMPYIEDIICRPVFPQKELKTTIDKYKQKELINQQKTSVVAANKFYESIFEKTPYCLIGEAEDFDLIERNDVTDFFNEFMAEQNQMSIIASGDIDEAFLQSVNQTLGRAARKQSKRLQLLEIPDYCAKPLPLMFSMPSASQVSLRIGKQTISHNDKDFLPLKVLNCVLGGYFGSRLMSNIREDKGLTYGINSAVLTHTNVGIMFVTADVKADKYETALKEIFSEMKILQNELIPEDELSLVKNYLKGEIMRSLDGSFDLGERFGYLISKGIDTDYFSDFANVVNSITALDLQTLAQHYLSAESFTQIVVGNFGKTQ
ncbi:MAG: insulinase family protein [Bacteroidales bacterium]|jgi:predicted Zn-dependent peptidase|nr:insulinase family protein [Bacteroidales bacterium]